MEEAKAILEVFKASNLTLPSSVKIDDKLPQKINRLRRYWRFLRH